MDATLYEKLLEELRADLSQTAPKLQELQSVESFLQSRLETVEDKSSYQKVLDDISADISTQHRSIAEWQRIEQFVSGQLGKPSFQPEIAPAPVLSKSLAEPVVAKQPSSKKTEPKPTAKAKDEDTKVETPAKGKSLAEMPGTSGGMTIEFGPDGFPINHSGPGRGKTEKNSSKATIPEGAGMDGATINFGPDGFPLDLPQSGSKKK